jgi:insulysin
MINIDKSTFDYRKFTGGQLNNGIKYSIISDKHLEKCFVSVCLQVGSFADPIGYEGLAHFLEHMLFMGSKKYPNENHYNTKLNEFGGYSNAYTDVMETVYYFNVYNNGLEEIFDIFSRFFIDPLFNQDSILREINAVDSEHKKNINQDLWRNYQLMLYLTDNDSMTNTFITGSLNSLLKPDIRKQVINFYNKYYVANNISICVASSKSTNEIYNIINTTFGHIPKSKCNNNKLIINKPFFKQNISKTFHLKTISNIYEVNYIWEIPYQDDFLNSKEFNILGMIITNKSDKSLYFHLKNKGYLNNMYIDIRHEGMFIIKLKLTNEGFNNFEYINMVIDKYLYQIINFNLESFAKYYQQILNINFNCINKNDTEDLCNLLAVSHHYYPTKNIYKGSFIITELKSNQYYKNLYEKYIKPNKCLKILSSQKINLSNLKYNRLPEYNAEFVEIPNITKNIKINTNLQCSDIFNEYLDIKTKLIPNLDKFNIPKLLSNRQWYGGCSKFGDPQVRVILQFNNLYFNTPKNYILTDISCKILNFLSSIILYKSQEVCFSILFEPSLLTSSFLVKISGLNDINKLKLLINDISNFLINTKTIVTKISNEYINNLIISFKNSYHNIKYLNPWEYSNYITQNQIVSNFSIKTLIHELNLLDADLIKKYLSQLIKNSALTTFVYGNIKSAKIIGLFDNFNEYFKNQNYPLPKINILKEISLQHPNKQEKSNCISFYYPIGKFMPKEFNLSSLLINILAQPFFDKLRTQNQLGYLVKMNKYVIKDEYYIIQKIQSEKSINIVETNINDFNKNIMKLIKKIDFVKFKNTLGNQLSEADNSLDEKFMHYYPEISLRQYLFNRNKILFNQVKNITKDDLINFIKTYINKENCIKIIINGNK